MKRRAFLKVIAATGASLLMNLSRPSLAAPPEGEVPAITAPSGPARPNFLFIVTDDQRYDAMSCVQKEQGDKARFPWFQTPNMDRLAREGVRFRNAFVVNSLCSPSRSNFLTGKYNHLNGVTNNHTPMPLDTITSAHDLAKAGYVTAYFGKWHHGMQKERPGFDVIYSFLGQGNYEDQPFNINGTITPTQGWVDDVTTDFAIQFLKNRKPSDKPFDIVFGFKSPHDPRIPPARAANRFSGEEARPVPNLGLKPPFRQHPSTAPHDNGGFTDKKGRGGGMLNYFRCISAADDCIGRLLVALDDLHLADNTIVIFMSDNGYYFGEHTLGDKRSAYEESMRVPLIVRYPHVAPAREVVDEMAIGVDLAPTLLDYAGVAIPKDMQGRSWRPLIEGKPTDWRKSFFYEYFYERQYATPNTTAVRTADAKLIKYPGHPDWTELFDLKSDPYETHNLIADPSRGDLLKRMESEYDHQAKEVGFNIPADADKPIAGSQDHF